MTTSASADNTLPALELRAVTVSYPDGQTPIRDVDLTVADREIVALLGASGSGKSTLLRAVAGLETPVSGEVRMRGRRVNELPPHRRDCGMVFQDGQLFPFRTVGRNVAYGLESQRMPASARAERIRAMLALVDLEGFEDRAVQTLSGGQAQRVALARSLAPEPSLLLLDEPLSALDRDLRETLADQVRAILNQTGTAALFVTHDADEADRVADRVLRIQDCALVPVS